MEVLCSNIDPVCGSSATDSVAAASIATASFTDCCPYMNATYPKGPALIGGCCTNVVTFLKDMTTYYNYSSPYDINSVMHYTDHAYALRGKQTLISRVEGGHLPVKQLSQPSDIDFERVCAIYSKQCEEYKAQGGTATLTAGVTMSTVQASETTLAQSVTRSQVQGQLTTLVRSASNSRTQEATKTLVYGASDMPYR